MTYFHMRMHTIIGAKSFHCPVRDGKEWGQLAMVVRHNWRRTERSSSSGQFAIILEEVKMCSDCCEALQLATEPNVIGSSRTGN